MDTTKMWDYRVVRRESENGSDEWYSVQEVYYDEDGTPMAQTMDLMVEQDTITGMRTQLESMLRALDNPVLDESDIVDNPVNTKTMEDRVLSLEMENSELKDRLEELGDEVTKLGTDGRGNDIFESPDGGKTIYRRKAGETKRTKVTEKGL